MEVVQLDVHDLVPNPWNVNRMSKSMMRKLAGYLKREGLVEPIVVRPHPTREGMYEILGGYHRWSICKAELGYETVPCVVVEGLDDKRAKILSVNLNSMKGEAVPSLLSDLLSDLQQDMPLPDLEATLPYDQGEIVDFLALMQIPEGFADELETEAERKDKEAPTVLTVVLDKKQAALWEEAMELAEEEIGESRNPKARTLELLAEAYLMGKSSGLSGAGTPVTGVPSPREPIPDAGETSEDGSKVRASGSRGDPRTPGDPDSGEEG
jgi:ParB-like chromosome segregation protein Spo0J